MTSNEDRAVWEADEEELYKARNATQTAREPVRALPDATDAGEVLVQQIAEAIGEALDTEEPSWGINDRAHEALTRAATAAVLPLVEAQVAPLRDEVASLSAAYDAQVQHARRHRLRAESAERDLAIADGALAKADEENDRAHRESQMAWNAAIVREERADADDYVKWLNDPTPTAGGKVDTAPEADQAQCAFCRGCHPAELDHCINLPGCTAADTAPESGEGR